MGKMTDVLNKVQESRQLFQPQKISEPVYVKHDPVLSFKKVLMGAVAVVICGAIAIAFIFGQIYSLKKTVKLQEKAFADQATGLAYEKAFLDSQRHDFNVQLKNEIEDRRIQINSLNLIDTAYYIDIMKIFQADTHQLNDLDKKAQYLKSKIDQICSSNGSIIICPKS